MKQDISLLLTILVILFAFFTMWLAFFRSIQANGNPNPIPKIFYILPAMLGSGILYLFFIAK